jgi:hypothetical protein
MKPGMKIDDTILPIIYTFFFLRNARVNRHVRLDCVVGVDAPARFSIYCGCVTALYDTATDSMLERTVCYICRSSRHSLPSK